MNSKIFYVVIFFSMLFLGNIFLQTGMSSVYGQDKPSLVPKSTGTLPPANENPKSTDSTTAKISKEPPIPPHLGCMTGTGGNTGIPCQKCDPGLPNCSFPPPIFEGSLEDNQVANVKPGNPTDNPFCKSGTGPGTDKQCVPCFPIFGTGDCKLTNPKDKGPLFNKPDIGGAGGGSSDTVLGDSSINVEKLEKVVQDLQTSKQEFEKSNDPSKVLASTNELEKLGGFPSGTTQKLESLFKISSELEGIIDGETSTDGTSELKCKWICKTIVTYVVDKTVKKFVDYVTNPCPGGKQSGTASDGTVMCTTK